MTKHKDLGSAPHSCATPNSLTSCPPHPTAGAAGDEAATSPADLHLGQQAVHRSHLIYTQRRRPRATLHLPRPRGSARETPASQPANVWILPNAYCCILPGQVKITVGRKKKSLGLRVEERGPSSQPPASAERSSSVFAPQPSPRGERNAAISELAQTGKQQSDGAAASLGEPALALPSSSLPRAPYGF